METFIKGSFVQRLQLSTVAILMISIVKGNNKPFFGFPLFQQMLGKTGQLKKITQVSIMTLALSHKVKGVLYEKEQ